MKPTELKIFYSKLTHYFYWNYGKFKVKLTKKQPKNILISDFKLPGWKENLTSGFKNTNHNFEFSEFTRDKLSGYDCVLPITIDDLVFADKARYLIPENPVPIPTKESIELCDDKFRFNTFLCRNGFKEYIPQMGDQKKYPYILKKKVDFSGKNCHIIYNALQARRHKKLIESDEYFVQELIPGKKEYATHIFFKNGEIRNALNIKYEFTSDLPIKGQDKHSFTSIVKCPYLDLFAAILNFVGFEGICCVNYKVVENKPQIIEINPRVGFSLSKYLFTFISQAV